MAKTKKVRTRKRGKTWSYIFEAGQVNGRRKVIEKGGFATEKDAYNAGDIPLLLLYHTGMRISEVLGLSWSDVNFAEHKINLRRQLVYIKKKGYFFTTLKTESSKRYILIDDFLLEELQRWQARQAENEKRIGNNYTYTYLENDGHIIKQSKGLPAPVGEKVSLVCTRDDGQFVLHISLTGFLKSEKLNAHSFRHTHATYLIEGGAEAKAVAGRLGHTNTLITQNLYTHNTRKLQEKALAIFDKIMQTNS